MRNDLLEPGEYEVHLIELPPARRSELDGMIQNQISIMHPGPIDDIYVQYKIYKTNDGWKAIVFLVPQSRIDRKRTCVPFDASPKLQTKLGIFNLYIVGKKYVEHYKFEASIPVEIRFAPTTAASKPEPGGGCVIDIHDSGWQPAGENFDVITGRDLEQKRIATIYTRRAKRSSHRKSIRVAIALIFFLTSLSALFEMRIVRATAKLETIRNEHQRANLNMSKTDVSEIDIEELENRIRGIASQKQYKPYAFIEDLYEGVGSIDVITSLEYDRGLFHIRVSANEPLAMLQSMTNHSKFSDLVSTTIAPGADATRTEISISGRYIYDSP